MHKPLLPEGTTQFVIPAEQLLDIGIRFPVAHWFYPCLVEKELIGLCLLYYGKGCDQMFINVVERFIPEEHRDIADHILLSEFFMEIIEASDIYLNAINYHTANSPPPVFLDWVGTFSILLAHNHDPAKTEQLRQIGFGTITDHIHSTRGITRY